MTLTPPVLLSAVKFVSGNVEHPHDKFVATDVDILFDRPEKAGNSVQVTKAFLDPFLNRF